GLGDPQLDALIGEALKDNPQLAVADARARAAQAEVGIADAARGPSVNAGASVAGARFPANTPVGNGHFGLAEYAYGSFKWGLDLWGGKRAAWQAALGASRAAEVDARAARIELSGNVARAYAQLGYAFAQQDLAAGELRRAQQSRTLTAQRVVRAAGQGPGSRRRDRPAEAADPGRIGSAGQSAGGTARPPRRPGRGALARRGGAQGHQGGEDRVSAQHQHRRAGRRAAAGRRQSIRPALALLRGRPFAQPADL